MNATELPILIGQFDSPFVRRVAIAMRHYGMEYTHRSWSVFRDADRIAEYNPVHRVPTLVLPGGEALVESAAILDALDDLAPDENLLLPRRGPQRRAGLRVAALCSSMADKGVALVYENVAREDGRQSPAWVERCNRQIRATLEQLERERAAVSSSWWLGEGLSHADIAMGVIFQFLMQAAPELIASLELPALRQHEARCQDIPGFRECSAPLHFPS